MFKHTRWLAELRLEGESFNGKLRDELLNVEIFTILFEVKVLIENWKQGYNQIRL